LKKVLFYAFKNSDTPVWAKTVIIGALGYLILPTDAVPDFIPVTGYSDDAATLATAILTIAGHIKEEHRKKAKETLENLFG